ncbi:A-kinase anchor protein 1, mitochondrial [Hirundo rustica]|uniref:A-kinase anchor protein 1, mitochondrial n=1 Tax=Hirundo rustica TaxID=43150 RepID=UPI001A94624B|nr:A-kinase anchor protein 1, mitochondrial [Hirundo rustica]XP_039938368.1 A-kinase anchor protein 1, mitochondrial [Hirundo rustica]XP_039938369.1 A-kinase anchor protein 1, mitochondrial [Hirundo rustica]XP_039938370.1 A-kinase anchor protein 1, mitochondrial [Hirundo rustica]XP_039938371.1 A-kinase anchor protein 1, mitochondrial [Hirundo rustica]
MALRFRNFVPYAIPGVLALLGCWWIYSWRKKHSGYRDKRAIAIEREKREEASESDLRPKPEACVSRRLPLLSEEERLEKPALTSLLSAGPTTPSLLCPAHERPDLSRDLPDPAATAGPSTHEDDSEKLESIGSREGSGVPARASLPLLPESTECDQSAVLSHALGQGSEASQGQQPPRTQESSGVRENVSNKEQADESSFKPPKEKQMPGIVRSDTGSVAACCLGLEKEASAPQAFLNEAEVVSGHEDSAVSVLPESLESACPKQSREEEMSESILDTIPVCQKDTQPEGDELEREKMGGVSLDKEVEKIEQVAIQIISKVILAATEEVLSGSAGDASPWLCQATASQAEAPLGLENVSASGQVLVEGATAADESVAVGSGAEEQGQGVTDCSSHGCLVSPAQGNTEDCRVKSRACRESQGVDRTRVENSLEESPLAMEDSGYGSHTPGGGSGVEEPLQSTVLSVTSDQYSDSLSTSSAPDTTAEQSLAPRESPSAPGLPEGSTVPYSNGILKEDGPDLSQECSSAPGTDGDHSEGSDVNSVDFVDSGSAMRKTVARQNAKLEGGSSKPDFVIWEIEVPKELVGRLIGKQGRFMSYLRQASGAKIYVSTLPYFRDSQVCHIEGTSQQVEKVLSLIGKKFKELCLTNIYTLPPPMPLPLHSLLVSAWLFLPDGVTVEVVVAHQVDAGHMFLQQHTHPTFHVLRSLDQQMFACYSQPEIPTLPTPVEVGIICAAPGLDGAWLRAQVISYFEETDEVELKYVDYGGYDKVKVDTLRQIRSDFLTLPFQGAEVLLDNVVPLPDEDHFSQEADAAVSEMTRGAVLVAQVTNYDSVTGLPLIQLWNLMGDEVVSINRTLVERGFARWLDY